MYDITETGNFEGSNIPNLISADLDDRDGISESRRKLFDVRERRVHPFKDDKILTGWNGLMIAALALGARILDNPSYLMSAEKAMNFILKKATRENGRLLARYRDGEAAYNAYLDDYAFLVWGLIELYESGKKQEYLEKAMAFTGDMLSLFWDIEKEGLYLTGKDSEDFLIRPKEIYDGAVPSGNSAAAFDLIRLGSLTGEHSLIEKAYRIFYAFGGEIEHNPMSYSFILQAFMYPAAVNHRTYQCPGMSI